MTRSPQDVFAHHGTAPGAADYTDVLFLGWAADSALNRVDDGVGTFVSRAAVIRAQPLRYTPQPKD